MAGEPQAEGNRGAPAVRRDDDLRAQLRVSIGRPDHAADNRRRVRTVDDGGADSEAVEYRPRCHGPFEQRRVEIAPADRDAALVARIPAFDADAVLAGDDHPVDRQPSRLDDARQPEPPQQAERAGVDRVAAQLVARKRGAIEQPHPHAGTRQDQSGDGARRSRADNQHVIIHISWGPTPTR